MLVLDPMASSSSASSPPVRSRGHIILRSHAPLPRFACAIPVPPPSSLVLQLRNTILAILTGQVSADKKAQNGKAATATKGAPNDAGLSYSEHLKQQTVHEWRLKSIVLELCQNALIAPETRERIDTLEDDHERDRGFVLLDEHDCALLEDGDEVNVWLKDGQDVDSLRLPRLSSRHVYGLPNQPGLTRSGTLVGPPPPAYSERDTEFHHLHSPSLPGIVEPAEPSSFSSSVMANPDVQYETTMRHMAGPSGGHRVLVLNPQTNAVGASGTQLGTANGNPLSGAAKTGKRSKPKRLMSDGSNALAEPAPRVLPERQASSSYFPPTQILTEVTRSPVHSPPTSPVVASPSNKEIIAAQAAALIAANGAASRVERQDREKARKAGQRAMPSQALVIGPGVQGKVGRVNSMDGKTSGGNENGGAATATEVVNGDYGNIDAFVSFTAASTEVHQLKQQQNGSGVRRSSMRSASFERNKAGGSGSAYGSGGKIGGVAALAAMSEAQPVEAPPKKEKTKPVKRYVKLPEKPELPPIRNLAPFESDAEPGTEELMHMPMALPVGAASSALPTPNTVKSQRELQMEEDAALARALSESLNGPLHLTAASADGGEAPRRPSSNARKSSGNLSHSRRRTATADAASPAQTPGSSGAASPALVTSSSQQVSPLLERPPAGSRRSSDSPSQLRDESGLLSSKAERRYNEVKKALAAEKERQAEQDRARREKARKVSEEKLKTLQALEQERRQRETRERWQVWEEVRARQAKEEAQK